MKPIKQVIIEKPWMGWLIFGITVVVVFILGLLASSIIERRAEAVFVNTPKVQLTDYEPRNEEWAKNYPREYQSYMQTADTSFVSMYNGNAPIDMLEVDPRMVVLWAGYAFSKDYTQARGHYYAITDIQTTLRTGSPKLPTDGPQPSTCWTCKSPDVPRVMQKIGPDSFYHFKWAAMGPEINNHIGCADCHDPKTMNLRITRPALVEAFQSMGCDINKATHQEMRSLVCAQCHVEYFFKGDGKYLTFPWKNGLAGDKVETYYDSLKFSDWTHGLSRAPMLKAQHPDYEVYTTGIHAQRGVSCADCHMPYKSEGGQKFTDHHIQSPLNNVSNSCQVCHRQSEAELVKNVNDRQKQVMEIRTQLEVALVRSHVEAKTAWDKGATEEAMKPVLDLIRKAQWRWDYVAAGHGNSFHSPTEMSRMVATGIEQAQEARILLSRILLKLGVDKEIPYPDISTKAKAQQYIGLDMAKLRAEKAEFNKVILPEWKKKAEAREAKYPTY
ncbi:MAG TPA: ammonia-forming cytochrome c nitrite reductase [Bacteroidales bacterium]|nr:ammonia-forming cytochrome c nitrite reductase [Bacteroidales bacterium]